METQCQHLTETQHNELVKLLKKSERFFVRKPGNWKTDTVDLELKIMQIQYSRDHTQYQRYMRKCSK